MSVNHLLRLASWYVDMVLKTWFPLEQEPSMNYLEAQADPYADAHPLTSMELARLRLMLHDQSSVVSEGAAESPGPVVPPAGSGHPVLDYADLHAACSGICQWVHGDPCPPHNHAAWSAIAERLYQRGNELEIQ